MTLKLRRQKGGATEKLLANLRTLKQQELQVGHFADQGTHGDSDLTYADLLHIWQKGAASGNEGVIKDPRLQFVMDQIASQKLVNSAETKNILKRWAKNSLQPINVQALFDDLGESFVEKYKAVFGVPGSEMPIVGKNSTPMLETQELKDNTTYRVGKRGGK